MLFLTRQGESLGCYNQKLQDAATQNAALQNQRLEQVIEEVSTKRLATVVYEEVKVRPQLVKYESDES